MGTPKLAASISIRELAALLTTADGRRSVQMLGCAGQAAIADDDRIFETVVGGSVPDTGGARRARVGIWEQERPGDASAFIRRDDLEPLELWSQTKYIPPRRSGTKRVVLIGESVARGFFHDPFFSPAIALQQMLASALGEDMEVIDLARIDIGMHQLLELCKSALLLDPDAMVIWGGNNWHPAQSFANGRLPEVGLRLRQERRWDSMKPVLDQTLNRNVCAFASALGRLSRTSNVPFLFMIPEVNLGDWRDVSTPPPLLGDQDTARWIDLRGEAYSAVEAYNAPRAISLAQKMLEMDSGTTPEAYYILADVSRRSEKISEAIHFLRLSREVSLYWPRSFSPTTYMFVREGLARLAPSAGFETIDVSARLQRENGGESLPDRELFHDYCHMTERGTRLCMSWAAEWLTAKLAGPRWDMERFMQLGSDVPADVSAGANFLAAVVNADNNQSQDIVRYHLTQAVNSSPAAAPLISKFIDFRVRRTPALVCDSLERLLASFQLTGFHLLYGEGRRAEEKSVNFRLIEDCLETLGRVDPPTAAYNKLLMRLEHGVCSRDIDLLESSYVVSPYVRQMYRGRIAFYRAFDSVSKFTLICDKLADVRFTLTSRVREARLPSSLSLYVNNALTATVPVSQHWANHVIVVPESALRLGVNEIAIEWPRVHWDRDAWVDATAALFEAGIPPEITPVFGDLAEFRATRNAEPRASTSSALNGDR